MLLHARGTRRETEGGARTRGAAGLRRPLPDPLGGGARRVRSRGPAVRDPVPHARARVGDRGPGQGRGSLGRPRPPRLRDRALRRHPGVPPGGRGRRHADGGHPRGARRRPPGERPSERRGDRGARWNRPRLRPPPAGARPRFQAAVEAPRRHERRRVPRTRVPAGGDGELPRAPRMGEGRPHDVPVPRRAGRGVRSRPRVPQPGRVRHAEAGVDEQPLHPVAG